MFARNNRRNTTIPDVTRTAVAMERLGKHVSEETNSRNNRRTVFSVRSVPRDYKKDKEDHLSHEHVRGIGQGEARHTKCKRFKLGGGQAYDR
jgi:hypothetical protein